MMIRRLVSTLCALLLLGSVSCVEGMKAPQRPNVGGEESPTDKNTIVPITDGLVATAGATESMRTKAVQLRAATGTEKGTLRSAVYVYSATVEKYAEQPQKLAARLALLGMGDVYLSISRAVLTSAAGGTKRVWYENFISFCHFYGMKVYAMRLQNNSIYTDPEVVRTEVEAVLSWNSSVGTTQKIDGISADLEPHTVKVSDSNAAALGYWWDSTNNYGKGGSNDRLVGLTLDRLGYAYQLLGDLQLCEAVFSAFQPKYDQGLLSKGCAGDFLSVCDWIMVMAYRTSAEKIWADVEHYLKASTAGAHDGRVSVAVKVHQNDLDSVSPSLKPLGWQGVVDVLKNLAERGAAWPAFRGIDYFQYVGLEELWEE